MNPHSLPRDIWPVRECTSREYLKQGARVTTVPQLRCAARAVEYGVQAIQFASFTRFGLGEAALAGAYARTAATLAKLAFPDLEETI